MKKPISLKEAIVSDADEDEFKSAESKTPPKNRLVQPVVETDRQIKSQMVDSDTLTEHSSDEEFEVTRPVAAAASMKKIGSAQTMTTNTKGKES